MRTELRWPRAARCSVAVHDGAICSAVIIDGRGLHPIVAAADLEDGRRTYTGKHSVQSGFASRNRRNSLCRKEHTAETRDDRRPASLPTEACNRASGGGSEPRYQSAATCARGAHVPVSFCAGIQTVHRLTTASIPRATEDRPTSLPSRETPGRTKSTFGRGQNDSRTSTSTRIRSGRPIGIADRRPTVFRTEEFSQACPHPFRTGAIFSKA